MPARPPGQHRDDQHGHDRHRHDRHRHDRHRDGRSTPIAGAGTYTPPGDGTTHWVEHLRSDHMSVGTYSVAAGGTDGQVPHTEDEVYVVTAGRARLATSSGVFPVAPGAALFVPAGEPHAFVDVTEDLAALVLFAPPEREPS